MDQSLQQKEISLVTHLRWTKMRRSETRRRDRKDWTRTVSHSRILDSSRLLTRLTRISSYFLEHDWEVSWDGPDDPANPKNWGVTYRWFLTGVGGLLVFNSTFASSAPSGSLAAMEKYFGFDQIIGTLLIALCKNCCLSSASFSRDCMLTQGIIYFFQSSLGTSSVR